MKPIQKIAGLTLFSVALAVSTQAALVELSGTNVQGTRNTNTNTSAIPVSSTDLINGLAPVSPNLSSWLGDNSTVAMTDGATGVGSDAVATAGNTLIGVAPWYIVYTLPSISNLTSITTTSGWSDARVNQAFDILVSLDGLTYASLSDGTIHTVLGETGVGFVYQTSTHTWTDAGSAQSYLLSGNSALASGSLIAANVKYLEFVSLSNGDASSGNFGSTGYRELDVFGTAVPEPSSVALVAFAGGLCLLGRFRAMRRSS